MSPNSPVWLLDVDGVVNVSRPAWSEPPHRGIVVAGRAQWKFRWAPSLTAFIRQTALSCDCDVRWATTWVDHADELSRVLRLPLFPVAFSGSVADVTAAKLEAALDVVERERRPLIWTDDEAIPKAGPELERLTSAGVPVLLVRPDARRGLSRADAEQIRAFLDSLRISH